MNRSLLLSFCLGALSCASIPASADEVTLTVLDDTCIVQDGGANDNNFGARVELLTSNSSTSGGNRRFGLLRFDFSSLNGQFATIDALTLKLRLRDGGGRPVPVTGQTMDIFRIADANAGWVEGTGMSTAANDGVTAMNSVSYRVKQDNSDPLLQIPWAGSAGLNTADVDYFTPALGSTAVFDGLSGYVPGTVIEIPLTATGFSLTDMVNAWISQGSDASAGLLIRGRSGTANGQIFFDTNESTDPGAQAAQLVVSYTPAGGDPYTLWAAANQLIGENADPTSDADKDDAINFLEFGLDGNPQSGAADGKLHHAVTDIAGEPAFVLTCPVRTGAVFSGANSLIAAQDGVQYEIRAGTDLTAWTLDVDEVTPALDAGLPVLNPGWSYRTFRVAGPATAFSRVFFQVAVSQAP